MGAWEESADVWQAENDEDRRWSRTQLGSWKFAVDGGWTWPSCPFFCLLPHLAAHLEGCKYHGTSGDGEGRQATEPTGELSAPGGGLGHDGATEQT